MGTADSTLGVFLAIGSLGWVLPGHSLSSRTASPNSPPVGRWHPGSPSGAQSPSPRTASEHLTRSAQDPSLHLSPGCSRPSQPHSHTQPGLSGRISASGSGLCVPGPGPMGNPHFTGNGNQGHMWQVHSDATLGRHPWGLTDSILTPRRSSSKHKALRVQPGPSVAPQDPSRDP